MTIVIPLFDEREGVKPLAAALDRLREDAGREIDVVLVDDGSRDGTWGLLQSCFGDRDDAVVLRHPHNRGLIAALDTGTRVARGHNIAWFDSDLTYDPSILLELADALDAGADVACASCYHPAGSVLGVPMWRRGLSGLASKCYRSVTKRAVHTYTSMVRAYRREVLQACWPRRTGFAGVTEVLLRALRAGYTVAEVPAVLRRRRLGQSKLRVLRVGVEHVGLLAARVFGRV